MIRAGAVERGAALAAPEETSGRPIRAPAVASGPVLVVEDEVLVREVTAEALEGAGLSVIQAATADEALEILGSTALSAVVTDVMMPGDLDGVALATVVRAFSRDLPVLVVSACHGHPRLRDLPAGTPFLGKPYSDIQLVDAVGGLLNQGRAAA